MSDLLHVKFDLVVIQIPLSNMDPILLKIWNIYCGFFNSQWNENSFKQFSLNWFYVFF